MTVLKMHPLLVEEVVFSLATRDNTSKIVAHCAQNQQVLAKFTLTLVYKKLRSKCGELYFVA